MDFPSGDCLCLVLLRAMLLGARGLHLEVKRGEVVKGRFDSGLRKRAVHPLGFHSLKVVAGRLQRANRRARFVEERKAAGRLRAITAVRPQDRVVPAIAHARAGNSAIARISCGDKQRAMRTCARIMAFALACRGGGRNDGVIRCFAFHAITLAQTLAQKQIAKTVIYLNAFKTLA